MPWQIPAQSSAQSPGVSLHSCHPAGAEYGHPFPWGATRGRGVLARGSGVSIPALSISEVALCLWGHPCPKCPPALSRCPGSLPSDPAGKAALCSIPVPGSIDAAGQAPLVIGSSPAAPLEPPAPASAPGCSDASPPPPLLFQGDSASPWCTQSRERRMSPGCTRTRRDPQGPTGTCRDLRCHPIFPFLPYTPAPLLHPLQQPPTPGATALPHSPHPQLCFAVGVGINKEIKGIITLYICCWLCY